MLKIIRRNLAVVLVVLVVLGGGAYAFAQPPLRSGAQPAPERPQEGTASAEGKERRHGRARGRVVHGDLVVRNKEGGFENVTVDRGDVVSHSETSVTIKRADTGADVTKAINGETRFRGIGSAAEIVDGAPALVVSKGDAAVTVGQRTGGGNEPGG